MKISIPRAFLSLVLAVGLLVLPASSLLAVCQDPPNPPTGESNPKPPAPAPTPDTPKS